MYMDMTIDGILKGLDQQVSYMRYNIIDAGICVVLVYIIVPVLSVKGYIFVVFISEIINFTLSFRRLTVVSEVRVDLFRDIVIPIGCVICSGSLKNIVFGAVTGVGKNSIAILSTVFCVISYLLLLKIFNSIEKEEIVWMKNITLRKVRNRGA